MKKQFEKRQIKLKKKYLKTERIIFMIIIL